MTFRLALHQRPFRFVCAAYLALAGDAMGGEPPEVRALTSAAEVRALAPEDARRGLPVRLSGVMMGEADPEGVAFVIQDQTEGIYVQGPPEFVSQLTRGDLIEVEGTTDPGGFAPYVVAQTVRKTGHGPIPDPVRVTLDDLNAGQLDAKWVEISGIVRSVEPKSPADAAPPPPGTRYSAPRTGATTSNAPKMKLKIAAGSARVIVEASGNFDPEEFVDAEVTVRGLCFNLHNRNRQFVRPFVQVPRGVEVVTNRPPPQKPFDSEPRPVASLLRFDQLSGKQGHRVHVRGVVVHHEPGTALWIRDHDQSLRIDTPQRDELRPGDVVDVLGFPALGTYSAVLEDALFRKHSSQTPPAPRQLNDLSSAFVKDADLVELEARLADVRRLPDTVLLTLEWQDRSIRAQLRLPASIDPPEEWLPGSLVRAVGVCAIVTDGTGPLGGLWEPRSFEVLLRSIDDLTVVQPPPWWNAQRIAWVLSAFLFVAVAAVAAVMLASRRRLKEQERRRAMAEAEFAAILNERNRVAREIHDTLSQNLGAISVQLELARAHGVELKPAARNHIATAHKLARAALADARESIWNMRSQILEQCDLAGALERILHQMTDGTSIAPHIKVTGERRRLPPVLENNLLRIGQEAITNATKHAHPKRLDVTLAFQGRNIRLEVQDDGVGFDQTQPVSAERRSFGLVGMKERAELLGGVFEVATQPGGGTRVMVSVPV
jgi:signal transduction histidine kinase